MTTTPAAPATELEPAAYLYGAEREEPFASLKRWPAGVVSMQCWTETPLYTADQIKALIEERDRLRDLLTEARDALDHLPMRNTRSMQAADNIRAALAGEQP